MTRKGWILTVNHMDLKRKIDLVIIHHTYKPDIAAWNADERSDLEKGAYWWKVIDRFHRSKGWKGIGYHALITPDGLIWRGRMLNEVGAHTEGKNRTSVGICLLGNFDREHPTDEQWSSLKWCVAAILNRLKLSEARVFFHRDFANKTCPGMNLNLRTVREAIAQTLLEFPDRLKELQGGG